MTQVTKNDDAAYGEVQDCAWVAMYMFSVSESHCVIVIIPSKDILSGDRKRSTSVLVLQAR
jgi:hypothetical protein